MSPRRPWPRPALTCALALALTAGPAGAAALPATAAVPRHLPGTVDPAPPPGDGRPAVAALPAPDGRTLHQPAPHDTAPHDRAPHDTAPDDAAPDEPARHGTAAGVPGGTADRDPGSMGPDAGAGDRDAAQVLSRLRDLYRRIGAAEEAARVGEERLRVQERRAAGVSAELAQARDALAAARGAAGRLAREEYRDGGARLPGAVRALLAADRPDPLAEVHRRDLLERAGSRAAKLVDELVAREARADALAERARAELDTEQTLAAYQREQREEVTERVEEAEQLLASLSDAELAGLRGLEQWADAEARQGPAADDSPGGGDGEEDAPGAPGGDLPPSAAGREAVAHAREETRAQPAAGGGRAIAAVTLGLLAPGAAPFLTGAGAEPTAGPDLVVRAWARAGLRVPLTAREQWAALERVDTGRLRPGDIVILGPDAERSVLYAGDGEVFDRPFPGAPSRPTALDPERVLGAVRPDPAAPGA